MRQKNLLLNVLEINIDEELFDDSLMLLLFLLLTFKKLRESKCKKNIRRKPKKFWVQDILKIKRKTW